MMAAKHILLLFCSFILMTRSSAQIYPTPAPETSIVPSKTISISIQTPATSHSQSSVPNPVHTGATFAATSTSSSSSSSSTPGSSSPSTSSGSGSGSPSPSVSIGINPTVSTSTQLGKTALSEYSVALNNFADVIMGLVASISVVGLVPLLQKVHKNGWTRHFALALAFQGLVIIEQALGIWGRYTSFNTAMIVTITWLVIISTLANRFYCIRLTQLLIPSFKNVAVYVYIANLIFFIAVASPIFGWWWSSGYHFKMWLVVGLPLWALSIFLFETGSMFTVGFILYRKTTVMNWYNQTHINSTRRKFVHMLIVLFLVIAADIFGLVALGMAYFGPGEDKLTWARIALYMLSVHFFFSSVGFTIATDIGYAMPTSRTQFNSNHRILY